MYAIKLITSQNPISSHSCGNISGPCDITSIIHEVIYFCIALLASIFIVFYYYCVILLYFVLFVLFHIGWNLASYFSLEFG
jgi:hypothetical protein